MALLRVRKGKQPGAVHTVHDSVRPTVLGRDPASDVPLDDDRTSRKHARLRRVFGAWIVQDLGSSNGTLVAGRRVERARVGEDTPIQIGNTLLTFHPDELPPVPGREIHGSRVLATLREEGGVYVHRAHQAAMDREVRLDRPASRWSGVASLTETFQNAAEEAQRIRHPRIDPIVHVDFSRREQACVVLRCRPGEPLDQALPQLLAESMKARVDFFRSLVDALLGRSVWEHLRSPIGLRHVTVSRGEDGALEARLPAIELSALACERTGSHCHIPAFAPYLPPELITLDGPPRGVEFSSAMYLLGAIGYHVLVGQPPMGQASLRETLENHQRLTPAPANLLCAEIPEELSRLLERMLSKKPAGRPVGRQEIDAVLDAVADAAPAGGRPPEAASDRAPAGAELSPKKRVPTGDRAPSGNTPGIAPPVRLAPSSPGVPRKPSALRRRRVGFLGSILSLPLWAALWTALLLGARWLARELLLGGP